MLPKVAQDAIRDQEQVIQTLTNEVATLRRQIQDQKTTNRIHPRLEAFAKKIAESKSKFAAEAREILDL